MPLYKTNLSDILFLDIETVSERASFEELDDDWQDLWARKTEFQRKEESPAEFYPKRAAIMAEFGKVVCVSCGYFVTKEGGSSFRVKSFYGHDEEKLLSELADLLNHHSVRDRLLCAHNGKEFDFPYLSRRMLIKDIKLPNSLNTSGAKPWEIPHLDTMEMWKFGDYKHYTSVRLLSAIFDIPTPKDDIDGSQVGSVYWNEGDVERIARYCEKDTVTVARIFMKMEGLGPLNDENIHISE